MHEVHKEIVGLWNVCEERKFDFAKREKWHSRPAMLRGYSIAHFYFILKTSKDIPSTTTSNPSVSSESVTITFSGIAPTLRMISSF